MAEKQVFISYAHVDNDFAEVVQQKLIDAGFNPWVDNKQLKAGDDWRQGIDAAIRGSFALIVIISPESDQSKYVTYEWAFAFGNGIQIIPVMYRSTEKIHPRLDSWHYEDFTHRINRPWDRLIGRLEELFKEIDLRAPFDNSSYFGEALKALGSWKPGERIEACRVLAQLGNASAVDSLARVLHDTDAGVRVAAADALGSIGHISAVDHLLNSVNDLVPTVRVAIVKALARFNTPSVIDALFIALADADMSIVEYATAGLIANKAVEKLPDVRSLLKAESLQIKVSAIEIIGELQDRASVSYLLEMLRSDAGTLRSDILAALRNIGDSTAVPELLSLHMNEVEVEPWSASTDLKDAISLLIDKSSVHTLVSCVASTNWAIRQFGAELLGQIGDPAGLPALFSVLKDPDSDVQNAAMNAIRSFPQLSELPQIIENLDDDNVSRRSEAAYTLAKFGALSGLVYGLTSSNNAFWELSNALSNELLTEDPSAVRSALRHEHTRVRAAFAEAIGVRQLDAYCQELMTLVDDRASFVRGLSVRAIGRLKCSNAITALTARLDDDGTIFSNSSSTVGNFALIALGKLGEMSLVPRLINLWAADDASLRTEVRSLLEDSERDVVLPHLIESLHNDSISVVEEAVKLLSKLSATEALAHIRALRRSSDESVRSAVIFALAELQDNSVYEDVESFAADTRWVVRERVASLLAKLDPNRSQPTLIRLLQDEDADVRIAAVEALGMTKNQETVGYLINRLDDKAYGMLGKRVCDVAAISLQNYGIKEATEAVSSWMQTSSSTPENISDIPF